MGDVRPEPTERYALYARLGGAADHDDVEAACRSARPEVLADLVTHVVFGMAAGEHGIPWWLRTAERVLDSRT